MSDLFGVTPPDLRATSRHLEDVSTRKRDAMLAWRASLSREGAAWGEDKIGDQFANGGGGYQAQLEWVDGSVVAKNGLLDHYSRVLKVAADSFERDDQG